MWGCGVVGAFECCWVLGYVFGVMECMMGFYCFRL
jgi:hypothetical protein